MRLFLISLALIVAFLDIAMGQYDTDNSRGYADGIKDHQERIHIDSNAELGLDRRDARKNMELQVDLTNQKDAEKTKKDVQLQQFSDFQKNFQKADSESGSND